MKPGATLGLSHGFLLGVMKNDGVDFRKDINVVLVAPKVMRAATAMRRLCSSSGSRSCLSVANVLLAFAVG
jgi:ketol-acid reductoisomerase